MRSADDIRRLFKNAELRIDPDADEWMFEDVLQARRHHREDQPATPDSTWRKIMRSPLTKLAAAAVVVIACLIGLSVWKTTGSGIALADVVARMEKVKAYRCKSTWQFWSSKITGADPNKRYNFEEDHGTYLISEEYGQKWNFEHLDPNGGESTFDEAYFLLPKNTLIGIEPKQKKYHRTEFDDRWAEQWQRGDPRACLKKIAAYKCESLGRSTIDGMEVEGFRTTDPNYGMSINRGESKRQADQKIWVDVKTRLPVRSEATYVLFYPKENKKKYEHSVGHDFQWDVAVAASDFEPVIPDDYTGTVIKYPAHITEETAIQGLKLFVELLGKYPEYSDDIYTCSLEITVLRSTLEKSETPAATRLKEEIKGLRDEEMNNKLADFLMPIRGLELFYSRFHWYKKDPAYYGKTVTPKDADKVLLRWKVSDKEYRVIFGDLHAETVSPEKLAELEKALPK
jgi:hypothetical protein